MFLNADNCNDTAMFKVARSIVSKYQTCPINHFNILFNKLKEQLDEIDDSNQIQSEIAEANKEIGDIMKKSESKCQEGHLMQCLYQTPQKYLDKGHYAICDKCNVRIEHNEGQPYFNCETCDYDLCNECSRKVVQK